MFGGTANSKDKEENHFFWYFALNGHYFLLMTLAQGMINGKVPDDPAIKVIVVFSSAQLSSTVMMCVCVCVEMDGWMDSPSFFICLVPLGCVNCKLILFVLCMSYGVVGIVIIITGSTGTTTGG